MHTHVAATIAVRRGTPREGFRPAAITNPLKKWVVGDRSKLVRVAAIGAGPGGQAVPAGKAVHLALDNYSTYKHLKVCTGWAPAPALRVPLHPDLTRSRLKPACSARSSTSE